MGRCQFVTKCFITKNLLVSVLINSQQEHRLSPLGDLNQLTRCLINARCQLLKCHLWSFSLCSHCFNDKDYALMSLCSWVNVVVGRMTGIDRAAKHVVLSTGEIVLYDHLILCTGRQYQVRPGTGGASHVSGELHESHSYVYWGTRSLGKEQPSAWTAAALNS